jgi:4-hydroxythreonine-4-phosphate dehydrogenase
VTRPRIAVTIGDPTGIGPEILVKSVASGLLQEHCDLIAIGRAAILRKAASRSNLQLRIEPLESIQHWPVAINRDLDQQNLYCIEVGSAESELAVEPRIDSRGGQLAYDALCYAAELALCKNVDAIVTSPLHKVALKQAGHDWPGHTELLASLCGIQEVAMMLYLPPRSHVHASGKRIGPAGFGVVHVTLHMALREVFSKLTVSAIDEKIRLAHQVFTRIRTAMKLPLPAKIAVAALNPHSGEGGRFGDEESVLIAPAVKAAMVSGIDVVGPLAVDTLMPKAVDGAYDAVVAMYHDQGHIALKLLDMYEAVNITLGLPILRTSVAHGTAHDIAWQGRADASGMTQAILTAARMSGQ